LAKVEGFWWEKYYLEEHFSANIATSVELFYLFTLKEMNKYYQTNFKE
jgi:hypothetical protein